MRRHGDAETRGDAERRGCGDTEFISASPRLPISPSPRLLISESGYSSSTRSAATRTSTASFVCTASRRYCSEEPILLLHSRTSCPAKRRSETSNSSLASIGCGHREALMPRRSLLPIKLADTAWIRSRYCSFLPMGKLSMELKKRGLHGTLISRNCGNSARTQNRPYGSRVGTRCRSCWLRIAKVGM